MLKRIWFNPPLAFARLGPSSTPCAAYQWAANDTTPRGTGSTTLRAAETLALAEDGTVSARTPQEILFRDEEGIRPVCPFFELHGEWDVGGVARTGPVTVELLQSWGATPADLNWEVRTANLKPFHYTFDKGDRVEARLTLKGSDTSRHLLTAASPQPNGLIPPTGVVPLGAVQLARPNAEFPEIRLRFYAPGGLIYGPSDLATRLQATDFAYEIAPGIRPNAEYRGFTLPMARQILNPNSSWARHIPELATLGPLGASDYRNTPGGLLATLFEKIPWLDESPVRERSLGLIDDVSDGTIACSLQLSGATFAATARVAVGPPDFAPANRPPVSLADNLADREDRQRAREGGWSKNELGELVVDIFERAFETSSLMNKDYQNFRSHRTNTDTLMDMASAPFEPEEVEAMLWPVVTTAEVVEGRASPLGLSEQGLRRHRRMLAVEYLEDRLRESPQLLEQWIRRPMDANPFFDRRMPPLMRGSDGRPLHLTRRQWEIVRGFIAALRADTTAAGPVPRRTR